MNKEDYQYEFGQAITESSEYKKHIRRVVGLVDDTESDEKLGKMIREYIEEEFPKN